MIYVDNAATTKMSEAAIEKMVEVMKETYGNPSSLYEFGQKAKEVLEKAREDVASVIGAEPREITFTSGGSEADNQAIRTAAELGLSGRRRHRFRDPVSRLGHFPQGESQFRFQSEDPRGRRRDLDSGPSGRGQPGAS